MSCPRSPWNWMGVLSNMKLDFIWPDPGRLFPVMMKRGESVLAVDCNCKLPCSAIISGVWGNNFQNWSMVCFLLLSCTSANWRECAPTQRYRNNGNHSENIFSYSEPNQPVNIWWRFHCVHSVAALWYQWNKHLGEDAHWAKRPAFQSAVTNYLCDLG